jgi:hypothetical protein
VSRGRRPLTGTYGPKSLKLNRLWLGGGGEIGASAIKTRCAQAALSVPRHPDVWFAARYCQSELRSIGVSGRDQPRALLLQEAAEFAGRKASQGALLGASERIAIGAGDFNVVDTSNVASFSCGSVWATGVITPTNASRPCGECMSKRAVHGRPAWRRPPLDEACRHRGAWLSLNTSRTGSSANLSSSATLLRKGSWPPQPVARTLAAKWGRAV